MAVQSMLRLRRWILELFGYFFGSPISNISVHNAVLLVQAVFTKVWFLGRPTMRILPSRLEKFPEVVRYRAERRRVKLCVSRDPVFYAWRPLYVYKGVQGIFCSTLELKHLGSLVRELNGR